MPEYTHPMNSVEFAAAGYNPRQFTGYYRYMRRIQALGAWPAPDAVWRGLNQPFALICPIGHRCAPYPSNVNRGQGACVVCAGKDPVMSERNFRMRVEELGGTVLYTEWRGANKPHHVRCIFGHDSYPRPGHVRDGIGICRICSGLDPEMAEKDFRARVQELGGTVLYTEWKGVGKPHHVQCKDGHDAYPYPTNVQKGTGICEQCHVNHDALYVVISRDHVKFGITSGDPRPRLADHRRDGFRETVALYTELPDGVARQAERAAIAACDDAGYHPVRGREYFPIAAMPLIADVISGHAEAVGAVNRVVSWTEILDNVVWSGEF